MVEENTTTCACQGGWMCPNCADQHRAEISRLKAELSEAKSIINDLTGRHGMQTGDMSGNSFEWRTKYTIIERQLAEARTEVERLSLENRQMLQGMKWDNQLKSEARQETAGEIIQYIIDQGIIEVGWNKQQVYEIDRSDIDELRQRYGLEG